MCAIITYCMDVVLCFSGERVKKSFLHVETQTLALPLVWVARWYLPEVPITSSASLMTDSGIGHRRGERCDSEGIGYIHKEASSVAEVSETLKSVRSKRSHLVARTPLVCFAEKRRKRGR